MTQKTTSHDVSALRAWSAAGLAKIACLAAILAPLYTMLRMVGGNLAPSGVWWRLLLIAAGTAGLILLARRSATLRLNAQIARASGRISTVLRYALLAILLVVMLLDGHFLSAAQRAYHAAAPHADHHGRKRPFQL